MPTEIKRATETRRLALQMLYQLDARQGKDAEEVRVSLIEASHDAARRYEGRWAVRAPADPHDHQAAFEKARRAWEGRETADKLATQLAPEWPTHRQPMMDRAIIRLCWSEMTGGEVPPKVAINEAIELAKQFGTERSAVFLNGVLDKMLRQAVELQIVASAEVAAGACVMSGGTGVGAAATGAGAPAGDAAHFPMQHKAETENAAVDFWSSDH